VKGPFEPEEFTEATQQYLENTDLEKRKEHGQYFTPKTVRQKLLDHFPALESPDVLDPAAGTGEFLKTAKDYFDRPSLTGWERDEDLVDIAGTVCPDATIEQKNSLRTSFSERFDVVVGNPPYFEFKPGDDLRDRYKDVLYGRVNIYGMFFKLGLELLKPGGWLGFVVSTSMNNGAYFKELRKYIVQHADIKTLKILEDHELFKGAQQSVMLMVLRKTENSGRYVLRKNDLMIFSHKADELQQTLENKKTLADLGWEVKTGRVVWNQHREKLTDDPEEGIPLIWSSNIKRDGLKIPHDKDRPQYVDWEGGRTGPAIVVNRVTGALSRAELRAAMVPKGRKFVAENHTNVVIPGENQSHSTDAVEAVLEELKKPENIKVMKKITGNTQVSRTELKHFFPLDL
jgi:adenine-specific DNA-methyltransferase